MDVDKFSSFLRVAASTWSSAWSETELRSMASHAPSDHVLGENGWLLSADFSGTLARWYVDGLVDLSRYSEDPTRRLAHLYREISSRLREDAPRAPEDELKSVSRELTNLAWIEISGRRGVPRPTFGTQWHEYLWTTNEPDPRCYLCGYRFKDEARDRFLGRSREIPKPAPLVDFVRPRGRKSRDLCIEIDHVIPLAAGGDNAPENLRLACGWCNRVKSSHTNIFDTTSWALGKIKHPSLGIVAIPQPLWVLRYVATRGRCESSGGCPARIDNSEIFVAPRRHGGALTPTNLAAFCQKHDPWAMDRYIGVDLTIGRQQKRTSSAPPRRLPVPTTIAL
jgi:hypothetical protein